MEFDKKNIEIELQKIIEEARLLAEAYDARKSLEEALSQAENKTSVLITEKEDVQDSKAASEMEVEKMREEIAIQTSRDEEIAEMKEKNLHKHPIQCSSSWLSMRSEVG
ncbi:hypothetical protein GOBAR_AA07510 [Gossypium barbadense]|uniref:Uncharacterized protein n=1 Tax=Gossypium barbadense TaxID=3634 RepID=A0A2P5YC35_GOSBA|nr:hypothetical protein GOBAR_AA07510 [Gossypium barbadense]